MTPALRLYGTAACHLCERAEALLYAANVTAETVDIAADDDLLARYGTRIPVLQRLDTSAELGWPFDAAMLQEFVG